MLKDELDDDEDDLGYGTVDDKYITLAEAARLAGVTSQTIRNWCNRGTLVHVRLASGHRRVSRNSVLAHANGGGRRGSNAQIAPEASIPMWAGTTETWDEWEPNPELTETQHRNHRVEVRSLLRQLQRIEDQLTAVIEKT